VLSSGVLSFLGSNLSPQRPRQEHPQCVTLRYVTLLKELCKQKCKLERRCLCSGVLLSTVFVLYCAWSSFCHLGENLWGKLRSGNGCVKPGEIKKCGIISFNTELPSLMYPFINSRYALWMYGMKFVEFCYVITSYHALSVL